MSRLATEIINAYFSYLVEGYGFFIKDQKNEQNLMGNGFVTYQSNSVLIRITVDRSQVLLSVREVNSQKREWLELSDVVHFFHPEFGKVYDFSRGILDNQAFIEKQAKRVSELLRKYCEPILIGDFSINDLI